MDPIKLKITFTEGMTFSDLFASEAFDINKWNLEAFFNIEMPASGTITNHLVAEQQEIKFAKKHEEAGECLAHLKYLLAEAEDACKQAQAYAILHPPDEDMAFNMRKEHSLVIETYATAKQNYNNIKRMVDFVEAKRKSFSMAHYTMKEMAKKLFEEMSSANIGTATQNTMVSKLQSNVALSSNKVAPPPPNTNVVLKGTKQTQEVKEFNWDSII